MYKNLILLAFLVLCFALVGGCASHQSAGGALGQSPQGGPSAQGATTSQGLGNPTFTGYVDQCLSSGKVGPIEESLSLLEEMAQAERVSADD